MQNERKTIPQGYLEIPGGVCRKRKIITTRISRNPRKSVQNERKTIATRICIITFNSVVVEYCTMCNDKL